MNKEVTKFLDSVFEDTFENEEGELYLLLSLLNYMAGYFRGKGAKNYGIGSFMADKKDVMVPNMLTPKGWSFRKTYIYLFFIFQKLEIEAETDFSLESIENFFNIGNKEDKKKIKYETKNKSLDEFVNKGNSQIFFKEPIFLYLEDKFYEWIEIKNNFNTDENIEKLLKLIDEKVEDFVSGELSKKYGLYSFDKQKELLLNKMARFENMFGNSFKAGEDNFWEEDNSKSFCYLHFFSFLFRNGYVKISDLTSVEDTPLLDENGNYIGENEKYSVWMYLQPKFIELIKGWVNLKDTILKQVFDADVKQILIKKKKNGELHLLEAKKEFLGDENKFVELRKKFPNSEINTKNYKGKTQKYEVIEKTNLDNGNNKL